jgi:hypothetical protein
MKISSYKELIFVTVLLTFIGLFERLPSLLCRKVICKMAVANEITFVLCVCGIVFTADNNEHSLRVFR